MYEYDSDRSGTHPGTSPQPTPESLEQLKRAMTAVISMPPASEFPEGRPEVTEALGEEELASPESVRAWIASIRDQLDTSGVK